MRVPGLLQGRLNNIKPIISSEEFELFIKKQMEGYYT